MEAVLDWLQALGGIAVLPCALFSFSNWRTIRRELRPNGGEAVFDRIVHIEKDVAILSDRDTRGELQ